VSDESVPLTKPAAERDNLRRNVAAQLLNGMFGQTGFRLIQAPTFVPQYLFLLSGSEFIVGLARSLQAAGTVFSPVLGAAFIGHRTHILSATLTVGVLMRLQILGLALTGFLLAGHSALIAFIVFLALMGFFLGMSQITMNSLRAKVIPVERRGIVSGARNFLAGLSSAVASYYAGSYFIENNVLGNGYASVFLIAFVITSVGLLALALTREPAAEIVNRRSSFFETMKSMAPLLRENSDFRRFFYARGLGAFGRMALPFYILFANTKTEISGAELGILTTVWMVTSSTTNLVWGLLADRRGYRLILVLTLSLWIASHVQILFADSLSDMLVFFVVMGMASGGFNQAGQNMVLEFGKAEDIPRRLAASSSMVNLVGTIGPVLGGVIVHAFSYATLFVSVILLQLAALLIILFSVPEPRYR